MTLSNAERQQRWRDKRNALAREAVKLRQRLDGGAQHRAPLRNDDLAAKDREIAALKKELTQAKGRIKHGLSQDDDNGCGKKPSPELMKAFVKCDDWDFVYQIIKPIKKQFGDGKWHSLEKIAAAVAIDAPRWEVRFALTLLSIRSQGRAPAIDPNSGRGHRRSIPLLRETDGCQYEQRKVGTSYEYRIFYSEKKISASELTEKLAPVYEGVKAQGKCNMATMSPAQVAVLAGRLRKLLDEWTG